MNPVISSLASLDISPLVNLDIHFFEDKFFLDGKTFSDCAIFGAYVLAWFENLEMLSFLIQFSGRVAVFTVLYCFCANIKGI